MPNFPVSDSPSQISKTLTQSAFIQNTGTSVIYLSAQSGVTPYSYDSQLTGGSSLTWPSEQNLWAVCAPGEKGTLSALYNAVGSSSGSVVANIPGPVTAVIDGPVDANITNASIPVSGTVNANVTNAVIPVNGNVNANISNASIPVTGTVNANITNANINATVAGNVVVSSGTVNVGGILTPVTIQGGGVRVQNSTGNVNTGSGIRTFTLPGTNIFYALRILVSMNTTGAADAMMDWSLWEGSTPGISGFITGGTVWASGSSFSQYIIADPSAIDVTVPLTNNVTTYSLWLQPSATVSVTTTVYGVNVALPYLVSNDDANVISVNAIAVSLTAATSLIYLAPSFQPYFVDCYAGSGITLGVPAVTDYYEASGGSWNIARVQPYAFPGTGTGSGGWQKSTGYTFQVPGSGRPGRLTMPSVSPTGVLYFNTRKA